MTFLAGAGFTALALFGLGLVRWLTPTLGQDATAPAAVVTPTITGSAG